jgi:hypothetical protein
MRIRKWVDIGQDIDIDIGLDDIRCAMAEAFQNVTQDRLGEPGPNRAEIMMTFNDIAIFLKAVTNAQISMMTLGQIDTIHRFLTTQAERFKIPEEMQR